MIGIAVTRALGDHFAKQTDCGLISVPEISDVYELNSPYDNYVVLASDGLWDIVNGETCASILQNNKIGANEMASKLSKIATANKNCHDNVSVIVIKFKNEEEN